MTKSNTINEAEIPSDPATTDVEAWLLELGLRAIQVERCPILDCDACKPDDERLAA